jgi:gamma-glutamyltranspeptidase/glutathione hydrolase
MSNHAVIQAELNGRPPTQVWGRTAAVTSMHPDATLAGLDVLRAGGNAVDAAIAVATTIAVTSQNWAGLAGDSVWQIHWAPSRETVHLDGYSICAAGTTPEWLSRRLGLDDAADPEEPPELRDTGIVTAMVPGTPAALCAAWRRYGTMPMERLCERAVALAQAGLPVNDYLAQSLEKCARKLGRFPASRAIHFKGDRLLQAGDLLRQTDLAETIARFAVNLEREFVDGETAQAIAAHSRRSDGALTLEDLAGYRPAWRSCLEGGYRGHRLSVTAPPTAGLHVIQALAILERFPLADMAYHSPESLHILIEATKIALSDRRLHGGDPDFLEMDIAALLDEERACRRATTVDCAKATSRLAVPPSVAGDTTHFVVIDKAGNVVNATQTIGGDYGSGDVVPGTGLVMNDRTWWMSLGPGPNQVAPGHRANIGHAPTILFKDDEPALAIGSPGGFGIVQYLVQTLVNVIDYQCDVQTAIDLPRFRINDLGYAVAFEGRIDEATLSELSQLGHAVSRYPSWSDRVGGVEAIERRNGSLLCGWDARRNSFAAAY